MLYEHILKKLFLGLVLDNQDLHNDRIKLWNDFNHAWLGLFQKQKDMMEAGVTPQRGQTVISEEGLKKMGKELVRLCDGIERHGLVDYEYGVWEEHIVASKWPSFPQDPKPQAKNSANSVPVIEECLDLYEKPDETDASSSSHPNPVGTSHHGSR